MFVHRILWKQEIKISKLKKEKNVHGILWEKEKRFKVVPLNYLKIAKQDLNKLGKRRTNRGNKFEKHWERRKKEDSE